ncbi:MAG: gamma-glutamylcyclotransferase, partial [Gammaproteobacteria bacterium]|nr:gamma-glutamylcyclotransferase [Gammaproteobacteria bacterium]
TYIATPGNEAYLGAASEYEIAQHISGATGPSGPNDEYLLELASALRALGLHDQHVFDIESHLLQMTRQ